MPSSAEDKQAFEELVANSLASFASSSAADIDVVLERFLEQIGFFFEVDSTHVCLVDRARGTWSISHVWSAHPNRSLRNHFQNVPLGEFPWVEARLRLGLSTVVAETSLMPNEASIERRAYMGLGLKSLLDAPLQGLGAKVHGTLGLSSFGEPRDWSGEEQRRMSLLAHGVASLLERKQAAEAFLRSEQKFATVFRANPAAIIITRVRDEVLVEGNEAAERLLGYPREEVLGQSTQAFGIWAQSSDRAAVARLLLSEGKVRERECRFRRKDGSVLSCLYSADLIEMDGEACVLATAIDLSERKRSEEAMQQLQDQYRAVQKMESVGRLAGGVAHDFNNILTAISASVWLALSDLDAQDPLRASFDEILLAVESASRLTSQLLLISRQQEPEQEVISVDKFVGRLAPILERLLSEDIRLSVNHAATGQTLPLSELEREELDLHVRANPGQLEQVLINLVVNARDAMPAGGHLSLTLSRVELESREQHLHLSLRSGPYVLLQVRDSGHGISDEVREHLFEPFFTTKALGHGTGLGLATCYSIVRQAGGFIEVSSRLGRGATFSVYLPQVLAQTPEPKRKPKEDENLANGERILFVEDEASLLNVVSRFLTRVGYQVSSFGDPREAAAALESSSGLDILFTDIVMPGMNGRELADAVQRRFPSARILFCSGHPEDHPAVRNILSGISAATDASSRGLDRVRGVERGDSDSQHAFLPKPYSLPALARKLRQLVAG